MTDYFKNKRLFLLDMDGTIYIDDRFIDGAAAFLAAVRQTKRQYLFLTNNSSKGPDAYIKKLAEMGLAAAETDFVTSADVTLAYLRERYADRVLYVVGTESLKNHFRRGGLTVTDTPRPDVGALVLGFDTELTFRKIEDACILLNRGMDYIATHPDMVCPTGYGSVPDCGALAAMLESATDRKPLVLGKPKPEMVYAAMKKAGALPEETVLIGDRLHTDIACGVNAGIDTVLVLSGEATQADAEKSEVKPTLILKSVAEICF
ncbi:MAG: HAD-IIA family hydrolase [Oscillospiraceae bacterium]|jgi:HAD superfamily hydrolase (TIGR01457 family)|nr:HAD-IIA family hydrolase [Oscillospiraceae bacterium]